MGFGFLCFSCEKGKRRSSLRRSALHLLENTIDFWCFVTFVIWSLEELIHVNFDIKWFVS